MSLLEAVADWNLEARGDQNPALFVKFSTHERVLDGRRCFIVGRKGTGKTALATNITRDKFSSLLNFDLFRFSNLNKFQDDEVGNRNNFITIWTYVIYMATLEVIHRTINIDYDSSQKLEKIFNKNDFDLNEKVSRWTSFSGGISFFGFDIKGSGTRQEINSINDIRSAVRSIEKFIINLSINKPIFIVFDDLDEDLHSLATMRDAHMSMAISLMKAVLKIKSGTLKDIIRPILCIRDDMYYGLRDNDRAKWADVLYTPQWNDANIQYLLNHRLNVSGNSEAISFEENWAKIFSGKVKNGSGRFETFDYIKNMTHNKPRDYIAYLQIAARLAINNNSKGISLDMLKSCWTEYSEYMYQECYSEIAMILDNIDHVFSILRRMRKPTFLVDDFITLYDENTTKLENFKDPLDILKLLHRYSIVGNVFQNNVIQFNYQQIGGSLDEFATICIHRALFKKFNIY